MKMTRCKLSWIVAFAAIVGCGGPSASYDATVEGTVTVDDQLATRGRVVFHPVGEGPPAYGNIFPNGTYSLRIGQGDLEEVDGGEIPSGEYIATVVVNMPSVKDEAVGESGPPKPGARLTAAKYADKSTSDLRVTVKPGRNVVPLELEVATDEEAEEPQHDAEDTDSAAEPAPPAEAAPTTPTAEESSP